MSSIKVARSPTVKVERSAVKEMRMEERGPSCAAASLGAIAAMKATVATSTQDRRPRAPATPRAIRDTSLAKYGLPYRDILCNRFLKNAPTSVR